MKCPSCNQIASSFLRNAFSFQGATLTQSLKGQLRCQHCGTLLRSARYGRQFWIAFAAFVVSLALIMLFSDRLYRAFGIRGVAIYWIVLILMMAFVFGYAMWRYAVLEIVSEEQPKQS